MLGNSYFLSALSALAETPERIERIFLEGSYSNSKNVSGTTLFINGIPRTLIVDDSLPCTSSGKLAFGRAEENELWVPLLEKSWAKACGSYDCSIGGTTKDAL